MYEHTHNAMINQCTPESGTLTIKDEASFVSEICPNKHGDTASGSDTMHLERLQMAPHCRQDDKLKVVQAAGTHQPRAPERRPRQHQMEIVTRPDR